MLPHAAVTPVREIANLPIHFSDSVPADGLVADLTAMLSSRLSSVLLAIAAAPTSALLVAANPTLVRASDASPVQLASLWNADERAVVVMLRHFG